MSTRTFNSVVLRAAGVLSIALNLLVVSMASARSEGVNGGRPVIDETKSLHTPSSSQLLDAQAFDTVTFDFTSTLEGWSFFLGVDTVQEYYPDLNCIERYRMHKVAAPFSLSWNSFGGAGSAMINCSFDGYYSGSCDYRWQIKSIQSPVPDTWNGASRIEARLYKSVSTTVYAMIGYKRPGDETFNYVGWQGSLPTNSWTTISLSEPTPGAFSDLEAVSVLLGSYNAVGAVYVDWVRRIKFVPLTPALTSPTDQATIQDNLPNFSWSGDGTTYTLQIDGDTTFASPVTYDGIVGTTFEVPQPLPNSGGYADIKYFWRVRAHYSNGQISSYSAPFQFFITGTHDVPSEFPTINAAYAAFGIRSGGTVRVLPGTYTGAANCSIGGFGERAVSIISSGGPEATIIDCQGLYQGFYYDLYAPGGIVLEGFTIRNASGGTGAAVSCWTGSPTIRNCIIENSHGWGIYIRSGSQARVENCRIQSNDSTGILVEFGASATITGCQFSDNAAFGLRLASGTAAIVTGCTFNSATVNARGESAAIRAFDSQLDVRGCTIGNRNGNGIESYQSELAVRSSRFVNNLSSNNGGAIAIYWSEENTVSIDSCLFSGNQAANGGGLYLAQVGTLGISHSTFVNNEKGIYANVEGNFVGPITLSDCIIAFSTAGPGIDDASGILSPTISCTDLFGNAGGDWIGELGGQLGARGNIAQDPLFCDAASGEFTIAASSPCAATHSSCGGMGVYEVGCTLNQPPILSEVSDTTISEDQPLVMGILASDPDETIPILSAATLPANATFVDNEDGSGTFSFHPGFDQAGSYDILFIASDGEFSDSASTRVTVTNTNRAPIFSDVDDDTIFEGEELNVVVSATDPDGTTPLLTAHNLPANASFVDHENGRGTFAFSPDFGQAGSFSVMFIASDGELQDTTDMSIVVLGSNLPPIIEPIADRTVAERELVSILVQALDPDETVPALSALNLPTGADFSDHNDGTGSFTWTPSFEQSGVHLVTFQASDGQLTASENVTITVTNVNRRPAWAVANDTSVQVGETLLHEVRANDPDGNAPVLSAQGLPEGAVFLDAGSGVGHITFTPALPQTGDHLVMLIASDGALSDTAEIQITVSPGAILAVQPDTLRFAIDSGDADLAVSNPGRADLEWSGEVDVPWLTLLPSSGVLPADDQVIIAVMSDTSQLAAGYHWGHINLASNGGEIQVAVLAGKSLALLLPPFLTSVQIDEPITMSFNGIIDATTLIDAVKVESKSGTECTKTANVDGGKTTLRILPPETQEFSELDSIIVHLDSHLQTADGLPLRGTDTVRTFVTGAAIWPGDTDHNGIVDERDVLPIGTYFGKQGPPRAAQGLGWHRQLARVVLAGSLWEPYAVIYADADGDGVIGENDICGVAENWLREIAAFGKAHSHADIPALAAQLEGAEWDLIYDALLDCPESQGRTDLIEMIGQLRGSSNQALPSAVVLHQNHPNPFNPETLIEFELPYSDFVLVTVYNIQGQRVRELLSGYRQAGRFQISWDGENDASQPVASGVYFYKLETSRATRVRTMILLR